MLVATYELATFIQHTCIDESAFLHDSSRCRIACKMVCPDVFEILRSLFYYYPFIQFILSDNLRLSLASENENLLAITINMKLS